MVLFMADMDRLEITWNEFRKMHKGENKKDISAKWTLYKAGEYDLTTVNEVPRDETEKKKLKVINTKPSHRSLGMRVELL